MKRTYSTPAICVEPLSAGLGFLTGSNEGYDVDVIDPGFVNSNFEWL